uniref:ABC transporter domain-containing protein n=1 Tax=Macrostomum lignano TaxID=282301 RepID=A0A1I8FY41_9PLAT
ILAPLLSFLLLLIVRHSRDFRHASSACQFKPAALASKGPLAALRAFCHLGVCQQGDQNFSSDAGLFNDTEFRNITQVLRAANLVLTNPTVRKFAKAVMAVPAGANDTDMKLIQLSSVFGGATALLSGVDATEAQKKDFAKAEFRFPKRWHLSAGPVERLMLEPLMRMTETLPAVVCGSGGGGDDGWLTVATLCEQAKFRENLKSQFDMDAALDQMVSTETNPHLIELELSDLTNLKTLLSGLKSLKLNGRLAALDELWNLTASLAGGLGGNSDQATRGILRLSRVLCGSGRSVFSKVAKRLRKQLQPLMSLPVEQFASLKGSTHGNDSARALHRKARDVGAAAAAAQQSRRNDTKKLKQKNQEGQAADLLEQFVPPEKFCLDRNSQSAIFGSLRYVLPDIGLGSILKVMFGVIPFYPDTPRTRKFLEKLNRTLQGMSRLSYLAESFTQVFSPELEEFVSKSNRMRLIRAALLACHGTLGSKSNGEMCLSLLKFLAPKPDPGGSFGSWRGLIKLTNSLMRRLYYMTACFRLNKLPGFGSLETLENYTRYLIDEFGQHSEAKKPLFIASLLFDNQTSGFVKYRLRFPEDDVDDTRYFHVIDDKYTETSRTKFPTDFKYFTSFFLHIQELLEQGIQAAISGVDAPIQTYMSMLPTACFIDDKFISAMGSFLPMLMTVSWIYNVSLLVNAIVYEKETRLKEMMKIMGLSDGVHWISWFITSLAIMSIASALMTLLLSMGKIIIYSNPLLLFFFIVSFVVSTIFEAFFMSIFFSNSSVAAAFARVIYFAGYLPFNLLETFGNSMTRTHYILSCLIPQLAFGVGCKFISNWELASVGLQYDNFFDSPAANGELSFGLVILMLWIDSAIFMLLTWYLEKVFPGEFGVPKPWFFPFQPSFWCGKYSKPEKLTSKSKDKAQECIDHKQIINESSPGLPLSDETVHNLNPEHFETEPKYLPVGIAIKNLTKIFSSRNWPCQKAKTISAVENLSYNFFEGQVTSFLGHNGAGKTTTMSLLTGLYTPTSGTAFIGGYDIRTEMDQIRQQLGLCPQHNVLFDTLTVEDHIYFYGMLKGLSRAEVARQVDSFIADVGLQKKKYEISKNLSGGMKRKLSVAMAFVGGSKVVVLDEPTAANIRLTKIKLRILGVDPHARRSIWDVLAKFRQGRTIILTTHHMDEADILGDRICIINKGRLVCSGSPTFLKRVFGEGYTLTLVKASLECDTDKVLDLVQSKVPDAFLGDCTSSEINVKLPYTSETKLASLFGNLEKRMTDLHIATYGIEDSSLEEIFLSVTGYESEWVGETPKSSLVEIPESIGGSKLNEKRQLLSSSKLRLSSRNTTLDLSALKGLRQTTRPMWQQIKALWFKRFYVLRRSKIGFLAEFVLPAVFILLTLALLQIVPKDGDSPPMELAPWYMLGKPERSRLKDLSVFQSRSLTAYPNNHSLTDLSNRLMLHMNSTDFLGTRCMREDVFSNPDFPCKTQRRGSVWSETPSNLPSNTSWCQCSYKDYPNSAKCVDWPTPARKSLMSSDIVESMQGYNLTNYIQSTVMEYYRKRFGGYTLFVNDSQPVNADEDNANVETQHVLENLASMKDKRKDGFLEQLLSLLKSFRQQSSSEAIVNQVWYDNHGYLSGPAYLNTLTNSIVRTLANRSVGSAEAIGVSGWTHPITFRTTYVQNVLSANTMVSAMTVVSIIFALSFIPASFVIFLISEKTTNAKHLQFVSGINPTMYWVVNHIWNLLNYIVPLTIVILIFVAFRSYEFIGKESLVPFLLTVVLFGFASAPLMYPFSWVLTVPSKAFTMLSCLNLGIGFTTTMSVAIVRLVGLENHDTTALRIADILKMAFLPLPHFCLGQSLMELNVYYQVSIRFGTLLKDSRLKSAPIKRFMGFDVHQSAWNATGRYLLCMVVESVVYFAFVLLLEYNCCCKQGLVSSRFFRFFYRSEYDQSLVRMETAEIDDDVRAEAAKVEGAKSDENLLELRRLVKIFSTSSGPRAAVKGISLGVKSQECFGFLGVNGAGKTTTFKMLTGDLTPTSGDARVGGFSILTEALEVHKQLGYCPQFDALLPLLTGRETLQLYARIRGVEEEDIDQLVETISKRFVTDLALARVTLISETMEMKLKLKEWPPRHRRVGIEAHLDKTTQEYSGGNKRKLSCGIAFIGNPPIVFLDEPTAGMDPGARRFLWRCIQRMVTAG